MEWFSGRFGRRNRIYLILNSLCDCMNCVHLKFVLFNTWKVLYFCNSKNCDHDQWESPMKKNEIFSCQHYRSLENHSMPMGGFDLSTVFFSSVILPDAKPLYLLWTHKYFICSLGSSTSISCRLYSVFEQYFVSDEKYTAKIHCQAKWTEIGAWIVLSTNNEIYQMLYFTQYDCGLSNIQFRGYMNIFLKNQFTCRFDWTKKLTCGSENSFQEMYEYRASHYMYRCFEFVHCSSHEHSRELVADLVRLSYNIWLESKLQNYYHKYNTSNLLSRRPLK